MTDEPSITDEKEASSWVGDNKKAMKEKKIDKEADINKEPIRHQ